MSIGLYRSRIRKIVFNYILGALVVLFGAAGPAFGAALCGGGPVFLGGMTCDMLPIGGGSALCLFVGYDKNSNGRVEGGSSDTCIFIDAGNKQHPNYSCQKACGYTDDCSKPQCFSSDNVGQVVKKIWAESSALN